MIRYFLAQGDRAGSAVIIEGLENVACSNPPPRVNIATIGMKTYCSTCKQEGFIASKGPRWPGTGPNGKQWALSGDINICGCNPPPVFYAKRGISMTFTSEQATQLMEYSNGSSPMSRPPHHGIDFQLEEPGNCEGLRCAAHFADGSVEMGVFNARGTVSFSRTSSSPCYKVEILADSHRQATGSAAESLLLAMLGSFSSNTQVGDA